MFQLGQSLLLKNVGPAPGTVAEVFRGVTSPEFIFHVRLQDGVPLNVHHQDWLQYVCRESFKEPLYAITILS